MKRVLVIENNRDVGKMMRDMPALANCNVLTVNNRRTGIEVAMREKPDLIISDFLMPVIDGYKVMQVHHKGSATRMAPVFILSAETAVNATAVNYQPAMGKMNNTNTAVTDEPAQVMDLSSEQSNGINDFLNSAGMNDITVFTGNRNINKYKKKQIIYSEGNRPQQLFYIKEGIVKTYKCNDAGKELITGIYGPGDFVGYVALLEKTVYKDTAVAVECAELAIIPKDEFEQLIESNLQVARKFMTLLAENVTEKEQLLVGLAYNSLRKKVAEALLFLSKKYKRSITISRDNLAALAGTATESLIRTLAEFRQEKLIDISDGMITIINEVKLKAMVN